MDMRMILYLMTASAGFLMIAGGMWLIYKEKIYLDRESNKPIEVKLPGNFSFTSNYPALALFALGFFPLVYPFHELPRLTKYILVRNVKIKGVVQSDMYPVLVYAAGTPYPVEKTTEGFNIAVPVIKGDEEYRVLLIVNGHVIDAQTVSATKSSDVIDVQFKPLVVEPPNYRAEIAPLPADYK
jgi:hypothetical protein